MANVYEMSFGKIYPLLVKKAVRKGRTVAEVNQVIIWMTGYSADAGHPPSGQTDR